jgi:acetyltransferase-like isoleucine patch superfamily enzyme
MIDLLRRRWLRALARRRCVLGNEAVVYDPRRIFSARRDRTSIVVGDRTHVRGELFTFPGGKITIGRSCYVGEQTRVWAAELVQIGDRVLIAHLTSILDNLTHPLDPVERRRQFEAIITTGHPEDVDLGARPVRIGDDAWIGCSCVILRGVTIGEGAVVGAGSVVTKDVPPWTLVAGNPARAVRALDPRQQAAR